MQDTLTTDESQDLVRLWRGRQSLGPEEMGRMYRIVGGALGACHPPELRALGESRAELVAQFIYAKVLRLDVDPGDPDEPADAQPQRSAHSAPSSAFALCAYFRRYLIDCTRASAFRRKVSIGDQITEEQLEHQLGATDDAEDALRDHGLDAQRVRLAARDFIAGLGEPERVLLCEGFGREAAGGLSGIAARHAIASYHYRAGRLGLVHQREGLGADYGKTQIGGWIQRQLGIAIAPDNIDAIHLVFKILGAEASCA
ncbi:MAG: hypothetical protein EOO24_07295 [Comamonadaceae bacterium]|nr:MAG: hypothetical protein EOO24_07295 [Comamonadaceae bacterium]